ncbi:hypothetical protein MMC24_005829 [Lignoscripta atroalba]|nr:hypothetical protein [Lignoscripta atroalba]
MSPYTYVPANEKLSPQTPTQYTYIPANEQPDKLPSTYYVYQGPNAGRLTAAEHKPYYAYVQIEPAAPVYFQPQPQMYYAPAPAPAPAPASPKPANHAYWHGSSKADVDQQNIAIAQATGATKPTQLVPYKPSAEQQWWCRELDATWTLRTTREIQEELQPGFWQYASPGGYPYFIRRGG